MGKRILIFIPKLYHGGGAERSSLALGQALSKDHDVFFLTQHPGDIISSSAGPVHCLNQKEHIGNKVLDFVPTAIRLKNFCSEHAIDVVIANMPRANTIAIIAKFLGNKTKNILVTRNARTGNILHQIILPLYAYADKNVAVSKGSEFVLRAHGIKNTQTIFNAFDFDAMNKKYYGEINEDHKKIFEQGTIFFTIGRLHPQKGYPYLIRAFAKVVEQKKDAKLVIAFGADQDLDALKKLIKELDMESSVYLIGTIQNVFPYLRKADAFVLASLWEGLPTVLIEALFTKTPVITTDCMSGPREILTELKYSDVLTYPYRVGDHVLITPPDVSEENFTKEFITSALLVKKKTDQLPEAINKYSIDAVTKEWNQLLASL